MTAEPDTSDIRHGSKIGRFVVVGELGKGGMGVVYAAHDAQLDRKVALKVLRAAAATDEERVRMLREGQAMARITHPNVITVYEVGVEGNLVFLAQELLDGGTLGQWLEKRHPQREIVDRFVAAGRGLAAAHAAGLVHRDFKPDNVLLGTDGRVRVSDFGLARALNPDDEALPAATRANMARAQLDLSTSPMSALTRTGAVMGTPMFMAPEQHNGDPADARSDQFGFCVAAYHALYGAYPFAGKTAIALADAVIDGRLEPEPRGSDVPARLRRVLLRGLQRKPDDRYPSMTALLDELARPKSKRGRNLAIGAAVAVLVGGAVVGGYALRTHHEDTNRPPLTAFDPKTLTNRHGIEWLTAAIDRDELDEAIEKYDMASALAQQSNEMTHASVAWSAGALVHALRGHLDVARKHLASAEAAKGNDMIANGYAQLAATAVASASGKLDEVMDHGSRCEAMLKDSAPELASRCTLFMAGAMRDLGESRAAGFMRKDPLALAMLDVDAGKPDDALAKIGDRTTDAARIARAQAHLAQAASRAALDDLEPVQIDALESFELSITARTARGEATALLGDPSGLDDIDAARADAEKQGFPNLALATRLARVTAMLATAAPDAADAQRALVTDARKQGNKRIAHLAETILSR